MPARRPDPPRVPLRIAADDMDQVLRLGAFRRDHPEVAIRPVADPLGPAYWEAAWPEGTGMKTVVAYSLELLLNGLGAADAPDG